MEYDVIVIGLGGMGSAALYHLARRGRRVLGIDQFATPHDRGSSHGASRIIRLAYYEHPSYVPLLRRAYQLWRSLETKTGESLLRITGSLDIGAHDGRIFQQSLESCIEHRLPYEALASDELSRRFPAYRLPAGYMAVLQPDGGILNPERCVVAHLAMAVGKRATIKVNERVAGVDSTASGVRVSTDRATYSASRVVVCAGAWAADLLPQLRGVAVAERQVVAWFTPTHAAPFDARQFPVFNIDVPEGHYYGFPFDGAGVKVGRYHHLEEHVNPSDYDRRVHPGDEEVLRRFVGRYLPDADGPVAKAQTCLFTNSFDEHFIIDTLDDTPGVVVAAGFSGHGFKFCSVVGEILADLAMDGETRHDIRLFALRRKGQSPPPS